MKRTVKILIIALLFGSAFLIAELSSASGEFSDYEKKFQVQEKNLLNGEKSLTQYPGFWDKFRESVIPKDENPPPENDRDYKRPPHDEPNHWDKRRPRN